MLQNYRKTCVMYMVGEIKWSIWKIYCGEMGEERE